MLVVEEEHVGFCEADLIDSLAVLDAGRLSVRPERDTRGAARFCGGEGWAEDREFLVGVAAYGVLGLSRETIADSVEWRDGVVWV